MSDHLAKLARRALQPARVHPRGPSRFEGEAPLPPAREPLVEAEVAPVEPARRAPSTPGPMPEVALQPSAPVLDQDAVSRPMARVQAPLPVAAPTANIAAPLTARAEPQWPHAVPEVAAARAPERLEPRLPERSEETLRERVETHHHHEHDERLERVELHERQVLRETVREHFEQRIERLERLEPRETLAMAIAADSRAPAPVHEERPQPMAAPPRVEISIGRIEVLPQDMPATPRREDAPRRQSAQSLESYLQDRGRR